MTLGEKLRQLRLLHRKQQKDVAADLGITPAGISYYETDKRTPDIEMLIKIADYYRVTIDDLVGHVPIGDRKEDVIFFHGARLLSDADLAVVRTTIDALITQLAARRETHMKNDKM